MNKLDRVEARDIRGQLHEVRVADLSFRASVYGVAIENDSVLLVPQWDGFDIPGGGIELGETTGQALAREMVEETGLIVEPDLTNILHVTHDFFIHPTDGHAYHYLLLYYPCTRVGGVITDANLQSDEKTYAQSARWVPLTEVGGLKFFNPVDSPAIIRRAARLLSDSR